MVGGGEDVVQVLVLLLVDGAEQLLLEHLREADDRVEGRAQLVRHVGQEVGLVLGHDLERLRALGHLALQALDQLLHVGGHRVEGGCERSQLVSSVELDALVVGSCADRLGRHLHALDRAYEAAGEQDGERDRGQDEGGDQKCRPPDLPAQGGESGALGLLDEHLPADQFDGRPGAQHLYVR